MAKNLFKIAKTKKIKYFLISFVDLFGVLRSKLVPAHAIKEMQTAGAGFAGFAAWLDMTPADSDMFAIPDPDSLIQLPWNKEVGWLASDLWMNGKPVDASPRVMLKNQIKKLSKQGLTMKSGVECEYFLISQDGTSIADHRDTQSKPCYDQSALMRRYDLIKEICDCMIEMGWGPYQNDHEDANGQFEMNWNYSDCLITADRHAFFKFMVKTLSEKHGLRATFMPKPFENLTGNGCHAHISVWKGKKNIFSEGGKFSQEGKYFIGGIQKRISESTICGSMNVNGYRRKELYSFCPTNNTWGFDNRSTALRVIEGSDSSTRFEKRDAGADCNPYLRIATDIASGLDGLEAKTEPSKVTVGDAYKDKKSPKLPDNISDAIKLAKGSKWMKEVLGDDMLLLCVQQCERELNFFSQQITEVEKDRYLANL